MNVYAVTRIDAGSGYNPIVIGHVEARSQLEAAAIVTRYRPEWDQFRLTFTQLELLRDVEWG